MLNGASLVAACAGTQRACAAMPSARIRAAPMSRAQSDIANNICKRDFRHERGAAQWSHKKKRALVQEINREFVARNMNPIYNIDKLEMWTGNSLYRWRVKRRNSRPKSWEKKSKGGPRQALAGKDNNLAAEPRTPIGRQPEAAKTQQPAVPAVCGLQPSTCADSGTRTPEPTVPAFVFCEPSSTAPSTALAAGGQSLPTGRVRMPLVRLSSAASGEDWWLPYRPGRTLAVTPELDAVSSGTASGRASGNREPAHVPASPGPVCRVTRPLSTLLDLRGAPGGKSPDTRDAPARLC